MILLEFQQHFEAGKEGILCVFSHRGNKEITRFTQPEFHVQQEWSWGKSDNDFHSNRLHYMPNQPLSSGDSELKELTNMENMNLE